MIPLTIIPPERPPPAGRGAGSLFFDAHDASISEAQRIARNRNTRDNSFMVSDFLFFCQYEE
jgi:hypothetical protein